MKWDEMKMRFWDEDEEGEGMRAGILRYKQSKRVFRWFLLSCWAEKEDDKMKKGKVSQQVLSNRTVIQKYTYEEEEEEEKTSAKTKTSQQHFISTSNSGSSSDSISLLITEHYEPSL